LHRLQVFGLVTSISSPNLIRPIDSLSTANNNNNNNTKHNENVSDIMIATKEQLVQTSWKRENESSHSLKQNETQPQSQTFCGHDIKRDITHLHSHRKRKKLLSQIESKFNKEKRQRSADSLQQLLTEISDFLFSFFR
jgi:hypothetical protein